MSLTVSSEHATLFYVLFGMAALWVVLHAWMTRLIATRHPELFQKMGRPDAFSMSDGKPNLAVLKFIGLRQHRPLGDRALGLFSDALLLYYLVFIGGTILLVVKEFGP